jgi:exodeoxyribonuclease I
MLENMATQQTFFFYDLETSGLDPRRHRIMQFAGIRTDMELNQIGEPIDIKVALSDEVLPDPGAIMVTGITPQQTLEEGYSEADFCKLIHQEVCSEGTIMVGFNSVRFDDEFMRYTFYRNFYDPYEWCWLNGRSRWDLLDVVRLTRAIRPDGIKWPVDDKGSPTNRLELITKINGIDHFKAHDALSDVEALIAVTKLIKDKQPKLYEYMLGIRDKKKVAELVDPKRPQPFVYASGRYSSEYQKTTIAYPLANSPKPGGCVLVYDLRVDPTPLLNLDVKALASKLTATWEDRQKEDFVPLPVKELAPNRCPAVAPPGVLDEAAQKRLQISFSEIEANLRTLRQYPDFGDRVVAAFKARPSYEKNADVDAQLYDGFVNDSDKGKMSAVRAASRDELADFHPDFSDERLVKLLVRYKARNYPTILNGSEREEWEAYRVERIQNDLPSYIKQLQELAKRPDANKFLLEELQLWAESISPIE